MDDFWRDKLTPFDWGLCRMVAFVTGCICEPMNGGDHYFIEADYSARREPEFILALWDAIEGRAGERLVSLTDDAERGKLVACVKFSEKSAEN